MVDSLTDPDPDPASTTLLVGPDNYGHWLVQQQGGGLEGSFVSQAEALRFARWERHAFLHARIEMATAPLVPRLGLPG
jgi:hypothetical protein